MPAVISAAWTSARRVTSVSRPLGLAFPRDPWSPPWQSQLERCTLESTRVWGMPRVSVVCLRARPRITFSTWPRRPQLAFRRHSALRGLRKKASKARQSPQPSCFGTAIARVRACWTAFSHRGVNCSMQCVTSDTRGEQCRLPNWTWDPTHDLYGCHEIRDARTEHERE